jgi:CheY-like chemotaxis protein
MNGGPDASTEPPRETTTPSSEYAVLIVEDDPDIAETLAQMLEDRGYRAETASNGREALERLRRPPEPLLILLDLTMPVMDGREFRRVQLETPQLASIPVVVLTADATADRHSAMSAAGWLIKPIALDTLMDTVARYCGRRCPSEYRGRSA